MADLKIDIAHPLEGKNPISVPKPNPKSIPDNDDEILDALVELREIIGEDYMDMILTYSDMSTFLSYPNKD